MELKGSKTEQNLMTAFAGESQARNKYTYFASKAKKEGYEQIAALFLETAENEKEHAKIHFKYLNGIGDTMQNLADAAAGENYEWTEMYKEFANTAREEGFDKIENDLKRMKGTYQPTKIKRIGGENTLMIISEHIVPETENTMKVYHLIFQLNDKERKEIAALARL